MKRNILSWLAGAFLIVDGAMKLVPPRPVLDAMTQLGYPESSIAPIGALLLLCTVLYLIPRTAPLGAVLLTGYLGGAVATNLRAAPGWFPILFPVLVGAMVWGGVWWKDERVRSALKS